MSSTTFSFSLVNIPSNFLHSCNMWLVDWWTGHFVLFLVRGDSPVAPANNPGVGLSGVLPLNGSGCFHSLFFGSHHCLDSEIFASFSSQLANELQVDNFGFPSTNSAHLPQRRTGSFVTHSSGICELSSWTNLCSLKTPISSNYFLILPDLPAIFFYYDWSQRSTPSL